MLARVHYIIYTIVGALLASLCIALTAGCGRAGGGADHCGGDTIAMAYARNLHMVAHPDGIEVTMLDPWHEGRTLARYFLTSDTTRQGEGVIHVPLRRAAVFTSVHCALFSELGALSSVRGVCDLQYMPTSTMGWGRDASATWATAWSPTWSGSSTSCPMPCCAAPSSRMAVMAR